MKSMWYSHRLLNKLKIWLKPLKQNMFIKQFQTALTISFFIYVWHWVIFRCYENHILSNSVASFAPHQCSIENKLFSIVKYTFIFSFKFYLSLANCLLPFKLKKNILRFSIAFNVWLLVRWFIIVMTTLTIKCMDEKLCRIIGWTKYFGCIMCVVTISACLFCLCTSV